MKKIIIPAEEIGSKAEKIIVRENLENDFISNDELS